MLADRSVTAFLVAHGVASLAGVLQATALAKQVYDVTGSALALGLLGLLEFLPAVVLVPVTGSVADRFDRRRVAAAGLLGEALCAAGLGAYALTEPTSAGPILALAVGFGAARAFVSPALRSLPPLIGPPGALPRLIALDSITWQVGSIVGPVVAGLLYVVDPALPYLVVIAVFLVAAAAVATMRVTRAQQRTDPEQRPSFHHAMEGLRMIRRSPVLLGAITLDLFAVLFGGAIALLPAIAEERLGVGAVGYGWLRAAPGIGAAAVTLALAIRPVRRHIGVVLLGTVALFGVATMGLGVTTTFAVAFAALVVAAGADSVSVFIRGTLVPLATPDAMRGRVMAVENVFIGASNELGGFESGVTAHWFGVAPAVVLGGALTCLVVGASWFGFRELRGVDRFEDLGHHGG